MGMHAMAESTIYYKKGGERGHLVPVEHDCNIVAVQHYSSELSCSN